MDIEALQGTRDAAQTAWSVPWLLACAYAWACTRAREGDVSTTGNTHAARWFAAAWNAALSLLSVWMAVRIGEMVLPSVLERGLTFETCDSAIERTWPMFVFCASKIVELGDTALLVFRGRPLSTLHVWHHASVMVYCWNAWSISAPAGALFAFMNSCVHSLMYTYYCLMSVPHGALRHAKSSARQFSHIITLLQIAQMVAGVCISALASTCVPSDKLLNSIASLAMYASYLWLFVCFYVDRTGGRS